MTLQRILSTLIICFFIFTLNGACTTPAKQELNRSTAEPEPKDKLVLLCHEVESFIAKKYFIPAKKEVIQILFQETSKNCTEEPLLAEYIFDRIKTDFIDSPQFALVTDADDQDCTLQLHVEKIKDDSYTMAVTIIDRKTNKNLYLNKFKAAKEELNIAEYTLYAANYLEKQKQKEERKLQAQEKQAEFAQKLADGLARLFVKVKLEGSTQHLDTYYSDTPSTYSYEYDEDTGSGWTQYNPGATEEIEVYDASYPSDVRLHLNGQEYAMDSITNIMFENYIKPGHYTCYVSYKPCDYYGEERVEKCRLRISRKFDLEISRDEIVVVHVLASYQGSNPTILVRIKKKLWE